MTTFRHLLWNNCLNYWRQIDTVITGFLAKKQWKWGTIRSVLTINAKFPARWEMSEMTAYWQKSWKSRSWKMRHRFFSWIESTPHPMQLYRYTRRAYGKPPTGLARVSLMLHQKQAEDKCKKEANSLTMGNGWHDHRRFNIKSRVFMINFKEWKALRQHQQPQQQYQKHDLNAHIKKREITIPSHTFTNSFIYTL